MASKSNAIQGQNYLFTIPPHSGEHPSHQITPWQELENPVSPENGPHITREDRAVHLISAMNALAHRNMLIGFDSAINDPEDSDAIWDRYMDATPIVAEHSMSKVERLQDEAKKSFYKATGYTALAGLGIFTKGQVRTQVNKDWRKFAHSYGDPKVHKDMSKARKALRKDLPKDHYLQTVEGWKEATKKRTTRSVSPTKSTASELSYAVMQGPDMPARSTEIDAINIQRLRDIQAKFDTTDPGDN